MAVDLDAAEGKRDAAGDRISAIGRLIYFDRPVGFLGLNADRATAIAFGWIEGQIILHGVIVLIDGVLNTVGSIPSLLANSAIVLASVGSPWT